MIGAQPAFTIRLYEPGDAAPMARIYFDAVRQIGPRRYSPDQVAAWAPAPAAPDDVHRRATDGRLTWVAANRGGEVLGYADLEDDGHIDHLYCRPDACGQGVAQHLLARILTHAEANAFGRLEVEASELARGLFARNDFAVVGRRDFDLRGVAIHNYAMEREIGR